MAKSALLYLNDELQDRTYTFDFMDKAGNVEELSYTFRVLPVQEVLALQNDLELLNKKKRGKVAEQDLVDLVLILLRKVYVENDEEKAFFERIKDVKKREEKKDDLLIRLLNANVGKEDDWDTGQFMKNLMFHIQGKEMTQAEVEQARSNFEEVADQKKKAS